MASARNMIRTLKTIAESRSCNSIYSSSRGQFLSTSSRIPSSNRKTLICGHHATSQQQQRSVLSGKTLPLHVDDLRTQQIAGSSSFRPQEQRRQNHRFLNEKNEHINKKTRTYESDLVVVLDMDECLIHSQFLQGPGAKYAHQVQQNGSSSSHADTATLKSVDTFNITLPDGEQVLVHERPHLHEFLLEVSSKYETHIFTAAMEVYAKPVLKMLDPHGEIFSGIWYRESCQLDSNVGAYVKNLGLFCESYDNDEERQQRLNRTVLVDNNPLR
jgi:TFIIF-interacting CTD phosphatase-like protein